MKSATRPRWQRLRTAETKQFEKVLRESFPQADAYRYNSASIRVRVIDSRFERMSNERRDALVEPILETLPESIQADIMNLLTMAPNEAEGSLKKQLANAEFEDPSPSML